MTVPIALVNHETYMQRCLQLASLGMGKVAPNPLVGAVLVYNDSIIGEGYHEQYGQPHAEVNCIRSVKEEDSHRLSQSTLYVSLEPCSHYGKTPPCADLIISKQIPKVVIACRDPFHEVNGKGIEKLQAAGVEVIVGILDKEAMELNKRFFRFHSDHRPYVTLKWAQTKDGKIAAASTEPGARLLISNEYTNRLVHKWRTEEMAILVGTRTAAFDDPQLTSRLWPGPDPIRLVIDMHLQLPATLNLFTSGHPTIIFNLHKHTLPIGKYSSQELREIGVVYYQVTGDVSIVQQVINGLYQLGIQSVLVEGGAVTLQSFIDEKLWDEAKIIENQQLVIGGGLPAPILKQQQLVQQEVVNTDQITTYKQLLNA